MKNILLLLLLIPIFSFGQVVNTFPWTNNFEGNIEIMFNEMIDPKTIKSSIHIFPDTELQIKEKTKATIRCILEDNEDSSNKCIFSGQTAKHLVVFAKAY